LTDEEPFSGDDDSEIDLELVSNHESDTEQDSEEESSEGAFYLVKDKQTRWSKKNVRISNKNSST
jgi:hypothetical protein